MTQNWNTFIAQFPITNPSAKMLVDLSHYAVIKVSGADAAKFLNGQLACDVVKLQSGQSTLGCYCTIKGKVSSLFRLWRLGDDYYLRLTAGIAEQTIQDLQKYAVFSKVEIKNVSAQITGFGVANHEVTVTSDNPELIIMPINEHKRYEIFGPHKALEKLWTQTITHANHVDPEIWEQFDIQDRIPELYPNTVDAFFAHDLNLPELGAVSFKKGCFRGQEIVARMQHRGNLKRHLQLFSVAGLEQDLQPGTIVSAGGLERETVAGTVVRSCRVKGCDTVGLAVINDALVQEQLRLPTYNNVIITLEK